MIQRPRGARFIRNGNCSSPHCRGAGALLLALLLSWPTWAAGRSPEQKRSHADPAATPTSSQADERADAVAAKKDIDVGNFYLHKGDLDAAIARYQDAVKKDPRDAKARLVLGEAYEKKGDKTAAVNCYKEYLKMFPDDHEAQKVRKKLEKLTKSN